jgi:hypothetical protein
VGEYVTSGVFHGFVRDTRGALTLINVPAAASTRTTGINARGDIVGEFSANSGTHGFLMF